MRRPISMSAFPADRGLSFVGFNVLGLDFLRMLAARLSAAGWAAVKRRCT
jgi:hypothetical protein